MGLWAAFRRMLRRIGDSPWETRIGVAIPVLLGMLAVPVMLGAFAAEGGPSAAGGYGTTTSTVTPPPTAVAGTGVSETTPGAQVLAESVVCPGGRMSVQLPGYMPGSTVSAFLLSDAVALGDFTVDASGNVVVTFTVPSDFSGTHTVEGRGVDPSGNPYTARIVFVLCPAGSPSRPGFTG